jgi:hypothetical protein
MSKPRKTLNLTTKRRDPITEEDTTTEEVERVLSSMLTIELEMVTLGTLKLRITLGTLKSRITPGTQLS